jgi:dipeptidyl aminopeptidase/acylaminoacyl peptidase
MMRAFLGLILLATAASAWSRSAPLSIDELRKVEYSSALKFERELEGGKSFSAYLVSYHSSGLKVFAYVAVPRSAMPSNGYPVLIANHGTHPNPPRYGFTAAGVDSRPGDYYRAVPELFASQGFLVVMPDYRGHNVSEGGEYARGLLASNYYAQDVLALVSALPTLDRADTKNVFMWGHSLGGEVTLRTLLATDKVKGASLWSSVGGDIWDQAYFYSRRGTAGESYDSSDIPKDAVVQLKADIEALGVPFDWRATEPLRYLGYLHTPLILHHSSQDEGAAYEWSRRLAKELYVAGHRYDFYTYPGTDHFLKGDDMLRAAERDAQFFRGLMAPTE